MSAVALPIARHEEHVWRAAYRSRQKEEYGPWTRPGRPITLCDIDMTLCGDPGLCRRHERARAIVGGVSPQVGCSEPDPVGRWRRETA